MSKIVEVIVDVSTMQTNQPFTYRVPLHLEQAVEPGVRIEVPFGKGNRHIQGFIIAVYECNESDYSDLKDIIQVLDLAPVVNSELLSLSEYMSQLTYSFRISCLQTMLPSVMKSTYKKYIVDTGNVPPHIKQDIFLNQSERLFDEISNSPYLSELYKLKQQGDIDIRYEVQTNNKVKTQLLVEPAVTSKELTDIYETLNKRAHQKQRLVSFFMQSDTNPILVKTLTEVHGISRSVIREAVKQGWLREIHQEIYRDPYANQVFNPDQNLKLNTEQSIACEHISNASTAKQSDIFLLEGITGSGKTEVYLQSIAHVLNEGKTAIMLVPEISLTPQTVKRFKQRFGSKVAVLHSGLSKGEKYDEWRKIDRKEASVVVGARSAVFAPLDNIGLIIVDEEHEGSYKQDESPRYHARDIAIWRAQYHSCPVVLGSATPSLESRARAQKEVYQLLRLSKRASVNAVLPEVKVIDMKEEMLNGFTGSFSSVLLDELNQRLLKKEQSVLMLNRRGYSSFIMCRDCGFVLPCPDCDISLTLHMDSKNMKCHYCGHEESIPYKCTSCGSSKIRYYGTGTQKVEEELLKVMPHARVIRMDVDTTRKKGSHEKLLKQFESGEADILLGTQMIAKGLDFPNVTLVGVLNADTALNLPDFRSSERTFQLLTQVSGRSGRGDKEGKVIIQTFNPDHYAIGYAQKHDYESFYKSEMALRRQGGYPPYYFTVQLVVSHEEEIEASKKMYEIVEYLKQHISDQAIILGPTPKLLARMKRRYYYQAVIKYKFEPNLKMALNQILEDSQRSIKKGLRVSIDIEPQHFV